MAGIATYYRGIEYRSRLEARWASFMHNIGWDITYEPFDGNGYIPDFLVAGQLPMMIEVKPAVTLADYEAPIAKAESGLRGHWPHDILIVGVSPLPSMNTVQSQFYNDLPVAGLLGEYAHWVTAGRDLDWSWSWEAGNWSHGCGHGISVQHVLQSYHRRPCDCYDGSQWGASRHLIEQHWANACNDVKWRGSAA